MTFDEIIIVHYFQDDKGSYRKYGHNVYAYAINCGHFEKAHSSYISVKNQMTYKDKGQAHPVKDEWIIIWNGYCTREKDDLKRDVTYFCTKNPDFLWINNMVLVEYTGGPDSDVYSNEDPHGNAMYKENPYINVDYALMDNALEMRKTGAPVRKIMRQTKDVNTPSKNIPDRRRLYDKYKYDKSKEFGPSLGGSGSEQALKVFNEMQLDESKFGNFVKKFVCNKNGKPMFILYEDWQVEYCKKCCAFDPNKLFSIIEEDKSYNITIAFLTHFAFAAYDFVLAKDMTTHPTIPGKNLFYTMYNLENCKNVLFVMKYLLNIC